MSRKLVTAGLFLVIVFACYSCVSSIIQTNQQSASTAPDAKLTQTQRVKVVTTRKQHDVRDYFLLLLVTGVDADRAAAKISKNWHPGSTAILVECLRFARQIDQRARILKLLEKHTQQRFGSDIHAWFQYIWDQDYKPHPQYALFKQKFYGNLDSRFAEYFPIGVQSTIRLDEVRWGGVRRDGIPPLKDPEMIPADKASYLAETDVVFGVFLNGEAKAYPKRILAWHEMVKDTVGGQSINGVYCTLCGSMIVYDTHFKGKHYELGTSGFLYRSNKLMYDHETKSMWSTLEGKPVIGSLVGKGIELEPLQVVTSNWGEWRQRHPNTKVLSLNTGHKRDYSEGAAYRQYFSTDKLMFTVPKIDTRLKNKNEILALRWQSPKPRQLAIDTNFLKTHPVYHGPKSDDTFVIFTDKSGASRVYDDGGLTFEKFDGKKAVVDSKGTTWTLSEEALTAGDQKLKRLPQHRAFWFGWVSAFPKTELVR